MKRYRVETLVAVHVETCLCMCAVGSGRVHVAGSVLCMGCTREVLLP